MIFFPNRKLFVDLFYTTLDALGFIADIRVNDKGNDTLYHDGFKFYKKKINQNSIRWVCTKNQSKKCKTTATTMDIDGTIMMKLNGIEHSHDAEYK